mgnify:CR=1
MLTGWKAFAENTGYRVADEYKKRQVGKVTWEERLKTEILM